MIGLEAEESSISGVTLGNNIGQAVSQIATSIPLMFAGTLQTLQVCEAAIPGTGQKIVLVISVLGHSSIPLVTKFVVADWIAIFQGLVVAAFSQQSNTIYGRYTWNLPSTDPSLDLIITAVVGASQT